MNRTAVRTGIRCDCLLEWMRLAMFLLALVSDPTVSSSLNFGIFAAAGLPAATVVSFQSSLEVCVAEPRVTRAKQPRLGCRVFGLSAP